MSKRVNNHKGRRRRRPNETRKHRKPRYSKMLAKFDRVLDRILKTQPRRVEKKVKSHSRGK